MNETSFTSHDYVIGGKLVVGRAVLHEGYLDLMKQDTDAKKHIKEKLIYDMLTYMMENNLVEFTQQDDPMRMTKTVMVRAYLAPNDQVKILRLANKIV